jgi:hypothetical protein
LTYKRIAFLDLTFSQSHFKGRQDGYLTRIARDNRIEITKLPMQDRTVNYSQYWKGSKILITLIGWKRGRERKISV